MPKAISKAKPPREVIDFRITLYALQQYMHWTDADLAKRLGTTDRTVRRMRSDPFSVGGTYILRVQSLLNDAKEQY